MESLIRLAQHANAYGARFNVGHTKKISIYEVAVSSKK